MATVQKTKKPSGLPRDVLMMAWVLVIGAIAPMLDSTMVNIAVNNLGSDFGASLTQIQWVVTSFVLATGVMVPLSGWLTDRFEGKRIFFVAELSFLVTSVLCGLSWNIESLIVFRVLQGAAAGLIIPLLMNLILAKVDHNQMGRLMATISLPVILGPILGPVLGGFIVQYASWRWIFFINVFVSGVSLWLIAKKLPKFPPRRPKARLDVAGLLLLAAVSTALIYGVVEAGHQGTFFNEATVVGVTAGVLLLGGYIWYAIKQPNRALLPLRLFTKRYFNAAMSGLFLAGIVINGPMLLLPLFFQNVQSKTVIQAALLLLAQGLGMFLARPTIGKLIDQVGARRVVLISLAITLLGTIPFIYSTASTSLWWLTTVLFVRGIGVGGITMPLMSDAYIGLQTADIPAATTGTRMIQNIGGAFGSAILTTIVVASTVTTHNLSTVTSGFHNGFIASVLCSVILVIPALFLTDKRKNAKKMIDSEEVQRDL